MKLGWLKLDNGNWRFIASLVVYGGAGMRTGHVVTHWQGVESIVLLAWVAAAWLGWFLYVRAADELDLYKAFVGAVSDGR